MNKNDIDIETKQLLMLAKEDILIRTIWTLTAEQKKSPVFREIGQQRYLSALRTGGIDGAEMVKTAFAIDPYFLKSKLVTDAAKLGFHFQIEQGHVEHAQKIKQVMSLPEDCIVPAIFESSTEPE